MSSLVKSISWPDQSSASSSPAMVDTTVGGLVDRLQGQQDPREIRHVFNKLLLTDLDAEMIRRLNLQEIVLRFVAHGSYGAKAREVFSKCEKILRGGADPRSRPASVRAPTEGGDMSSFRIPRRASTPGASNTTTKKAQLPKRAKTPTPRSIVSESAIYEPLIPFSLTEYPVYVPTPIQPIIPAPKKGILKKQSKYSPMFQPTPVSAAIVSSDDEGRPEPAVPQQKSRGSKSTWTVVDTPSATMRSSSSTAVSSARTMRSSSALHVASFLPVRPSTSSGTVPPLFTLCKQFILGDPFVSSDVHVPFRKVQHLLETYSTDALHTVEITMPWLESGIESIWRKRLTREFASARLYPMETYGEAYRRCLVEKELEMMDIGSIQAVSLPFLAPSLDAPPPPTPATRSSSRKRKLPAK